MGTGKQKKLKIKAKAGIQNGRLNAGNCFHPSILRHPSIPSIPKTKNRKDGKQKYNNESASGAGY